MRVKYIWTKEDLKKLGVVLTNREFPNKNHIWKIGYIYLGSQQYYCKTNILSDGWTYHFPTEQQVLDWLNEGDGAEPITSEKAIQLYGEFEVNYTIDS